MRTLAIRLLSGSFAVACVGITAASAATTTTLLPTDDVTLRGGVSADTNFNTDVTEALSTNASSTLDSQRRILLKFDTSTVAAGTTITSAKLHMTLKAAGANLQRSVTAYWVTKSFLETEATWNNYRTASPWTTPGGDLGTKYTTTSVGTTVGTRVEFDVTQLVQAAINNSFSTRFARIELVDTAAASDTSSRVFFRKEDGANRPDVTLPETGELSFMPPQTSRHTGDGSASPGYLADKE